MCCLVAFNIYPFSILFFHFDSKYYQSFRQQKYSPFSIVFLTWQKFIVFFCSRAPSKSKFYPSKAFNIPMHKKVSLSFLQKYFIVAQSYFYHKCTINAGRHASFSKIPIPTQTYSLLHSF